MKLALAAAAIALTATPALAAGALPDGRYTCNWEGQLLGVFEIAGETYKGPSIDGTFGEAQNFTYLDGGKIYWLGSLPSLEEASYTADSTTIRPGPSGAPGFDLVLLTPDQSGFITVPCDIE